MMLPSLPLRRPDGHKGDFGRALLIGGSRGMSGAIALAGRAALRGGAGLVQLAVPDSCQATVAAIEPSYLTAALPADAAGRISLPALSLLLELAEAATAVACGPGLGRSRGLDHLVVELYARVARPLVLDADALNALAGQMDEAVKPAAPRVLTPHPGEFARLLGISTREVQARREKLATQFAKRYHVVVVLKGRGTVVTDGQRTEVNATGNPGMATGGTGDVLTGLITALLCQGLPPFDASRLGAHLHGLAGDLAAERLGQIALIASDLAEYLPAAFNVLSGLAPATG
jgi:ADP-dependent NAD(P)H-hydrate dehydratase